MELFLVVFTLNHEDFAVPIEQVREINRLVQITPLPKAPQSILGLINLRGRVIPVVSLRERFGLPRGETNDASRIVVGEVGGQTVGFLVDAVTEVMRLDGSCIEPSPQAVSGIDSTFIKGLGKMDDRIIILLDLTKVFDFSTMPTAVAEAQ